MLATQPNQFEIMNKPQFIIQKKRHNSTNWFPIWHELLHPDKSGDYVLEYLKKLATVDNSGEYRLIYQKGIND